MTEITVLTLNLWGIFNSKMREARMIAFAQKVGHYDVILLQEQFTDDDWALIHRHLPAEVRSSRYAQRFPSSFYGSGCAVFSRYPITSALFFTYPLQGYPEMILHGDFFANKGAACIRLQVPVVGGGAGSTAQTEELVVYTTHLVAVYERISALRGPAEERYHAIRLSQAISLADFVAQTSKPDDAIIVGGDFNCGQDSLEVKTFLAILARRGFHLHSTLPSPRAVRSVGGRTLAEALHTFSDRNPFNVSKTSYFKLLGMQADIPAQIDHLIISANRLRVENYRDCPDVPADYPLFARPPPATTTTTTSAGDGAEHQPASSTTTPCAVVVMQDCHVVSRPEEAHVVEQLLQRVVAMRGGVETSKAPTLCPISDHYGVAAKLSLRRGATTTTTPGVEVATADTAVLAQASAVLNAFTNKLDRDTRISMYMAGISSALLLCHVGMLAHHARQTTRVGADVLQLLYLEGRQAGNAEVPTVGDVSRQVATKALRATSAATRWVVSTAKSIAAPPSASNNNNNHHLAAPVQPLPLAEVVPHIAHEAQTQVVEELPNFLGTATQLMQKPFSLQPAIYTFNVVAAAIVSITSLAVGLIQRRGNSAIAQEQARRVREM